jgi:hypothetical protein
MPDYDYIVSLGGMCQPAWNIRNCFGTEDAYPFDWLITPGSSLLKILDDDFRDALILENLEAIQNRDTVLCRYYEVLHHHDFPRDRARKIVADLTPYLSDLRSKYRFLWIGFYRFGGECCSSVRKAATRT